MAFGMDVGMRGHRHASLLTMRVMIAYQKAPTRMRFPGDGMHMLSTSDVITTNFAFLTTFCDTLSCFLYHACIPYVIPLLFYSRYSRSVSISHLEESRKQSTTTHGQDTLLFFLVLVKVYRSITLAVLYMPSITTYFVILTPLLH
jgi:hypothetical protein